MTAGDSARETERERERDRHTEILSCCRAVSCATQHDRKTMPNDRDSAEFYSPVESYSNHESVLRCRGWAVSAFGQPSRMMPPRGMECRREEFSLVVVVFVGTPCCVRRRCAVLDQHVGPYTEPTEREIQLAKWTASCREQPVPGATPMSFSNRLYSRTNGFANSYLLTTYSPLFFLL